MFNVFYLWVSAKFMVHSYYQTFCYTYSFIFNICPNSTKNRTFCFIFIYDRLFAVWLWVLLKCLSNGQRIYTLVTSFSPLHRPNTFSSSLDFSASTWERLLQGIAEESQCVCTCSPCSEDLHGNYLYTFGQQGGRTLNRVGIHLCCLVLQLPLSNW